MTSEDMLVSFEKLLKIEDLYASHRLFGMFSNVDEVVEDLENICKKNDYPSHSLTFKRVDNLLILNMKVDANGR